MKYLLGTKDKKWFFRYHAEGSTIITSDPFQALLVNNIDDIPSDWIKNTIKCAGKFIDSNGPEMNKLLDEVDGIKIEENDLCIYEFETEIKYSLKELEK